MIYELRIYTANPGAMSRLQARFRDHTVRLFERHGIHGIVRQRESPEITVHDDRGILDPTLTQAMPQHLAVDLRGYETDHGRSVRAQRERVVTEAGTDLEHPATLGQRQKEPPARAR